MEFLPATLVLGFLMFVQAVRDLFHSGVDSNSFLTVCLFDMHNKVYIRHMKIIMR